MTSIWKRVLTIAIAMVAWNRAIGQCPEKYLRYSARHTFCLPANTSCKIVTNTVTPTQAKEIVRLHNHYRSRIAMGKETIGKLPAATDMLQMEWSDELAAVAQKHADQCRYAHDCNECRETENFEAGQNIYLHWMTGSSSLRMDWDTAVKTWYNEVKDFNRNIINSYDEGAGSGQIGHFTQIIWSRTWKVGCGWVAFKKAGTIYEMHTCNYGPAGNMNNDFVYKSGSTCSNCPGDTCCGAMCNKQPNYPGLCQVLPGKRPRYSPPTGKYNYYCDFSETSNCNIKSPAGMKQWKIDRTLSGNHLSIVLSGGERSLFNITSPFKSTSATCLVIVYKKGPNVAGSGGRNEALEHFTLAGYQMKEPLQDSKVYMTFSMNLDFSRDFKFALSFSVPRSSPPQYIKIKEIYSKPGHCTH